MNINETRRLALVNNLLRMTMPLDALIQQLSAMNWDYEGDGVELTPEHLVDALRRYLLGEVSAADIELWANQVEGRDDVQFESESVIEEVLYELANPLLTQQLNHIRATQLVSSLTTSR